MTLFPFRMAWRETRAAWRHFVYFFVCIALGVGALVGVALFAAGLEESVTREARALLGGDLEIRLSRSLTEEGQAVLGSLADRGIRMTRATELVAMAAVSGGGRRQETQLVELKAVEEGYPLYGHLGLEPDRPLENLLASVEEPCERGSSPHLSREGVVGAKEKGCFGALVHESLLIKLGLSRRDHIKIGQATFIIQGLIRQEPDRVATAFSLGPRVLISPEGLAAAELVKPGSRVRERYLLRLPSTIRPQALLYELRGRLAGENPRISTYRSAQPRLKRFLDQLTRYLGLVGLTALFVGGIGVGSTVNAFIKEKFRTIAILKTLGADSTTVVATYLVQALCLGLIGSLAGVGIGLGLMAGFPFLVKGLFPTHLLGYTGFSIVFTPFGFLPVLKGMALGMLTTLLFTLWPLLGVREVRPVSIFRREMDPEIPSHLKEGHKGKVGWRRLLGPGDRVRTFAGIVMVTGLAGLAVWQAGSWGIGLLFIGSFVGSVVLLMMAALALVRILARIPGPRSLALRQAIGNLRRPGNQASGIMVSIGLGVMVIVAISVLERSLVRHIGESRPTDAPTFFFIDIQPDQKNGFVELMVQWPGLSTPEVTPLVRSRLYALDGKRVAVDNHSEMEGEQKKKGRKKWYLTREYVLTFLEDIPRDNQVIEGSWWVPGARSQVPQVSVEEEAARNLGIHIGSTVEFDIQGATVTATVSSIRRVDWGNLSTNFYMILSPGALEGAPHTYVATVRVPPEQEVSLQQAVVAAFPNVTAVHVGEVLGRFSDILDRLSLAIKAMALFCIVAGAVVMAASLTATKYRRLYDSVVLKALGATRGLIVRTFAAEYALLGMIAGFIGVLLAAGLSWTVLFFFLDVPWAFSPDILLVGWALTVLLALAVGFLSTFRILGHPPLAILREE